MEVHSVKCNVRFLWSELGIKFALRRFSIANAAMFSLTLSVWRCWWFHAGFASWRTRDYRANDNFYITAGTAVLANGWQHSVYRKRRHAVAYRGTAGVANVVRRLVHSSGAASCRRALSLAVRLRTARRTPSTSQRVALSLARGIAGRVRWTFSLSYQTQFKVWRLIIVHT